MALLQVRHGQRSRVRRGTVVGEAHAGRHDGKDGMLRRNPDVDTLKGKGEVVIGRGVSAQPPAMRAVGNRPVDAEKSWGAGFSPVIPDLLRALNLRQTLVSCDAAGGQLLNANLIIAGGG